MTTFERIKSFAGQYRFLSNFYEAPLTIGREIWPTAEHLFQAHKVQGSCSSCQEWRHKVRVQSSASRARRIGRQLPLRTDWEEIKMRVMEQTTRVKFKQHPDLCQRLLDR